MNREKHVETLVPIDGRSPRGRDRNIGTFQERIVLLAAAEDVLESMKQSGHFEGVDLDSLSTTIVGFLRGSPSNLLGVCSYARGKGKRNDVRPGERAWRILVNQQLIYQNDLWELEATIYHEYLHAILGSNEGHGATFQAYEALWPFDRGE
jgi:hypothetical protein